MILHVSTGRGCQSVVVQSGIIAWLVRSMQPLYTGHLEVDMYVETPFFIADPRSNSSDPRKAAQSIKNSQGEYIIPGSSLKGMIRSVIETLGNGCLTLFDGSYERNRVNYRGEKLRINFSIVMITPNSVLPVVLLGCSKNAHRVSSSAKSTLAMHAPMPIKSISMILSIPKP